MIRNMQPPDVLVAEEQGKLDPQAPSYVQRRGQVPVDAKADADAITTPPSSSRSDVDVKDAAMIA